MPLPSPSPQPDGEVLVGMARHFGSAMPYRWEIVRPFDRYGEQIGPEFANEADAITFGIGRGWVGGGGQS